MEKHVSSSELLRRCLKGRHDADWRLFQERHDAMLRRIVAAMLRRRVPLSAAGELDDALQDLYFRLLRYGGCFGGSTDRELWAFLCRTAASVVIDIWRRWHRGAGKVLSAGLLRSTETLAELRGRRRGPPRGGMPWGPLPECWLDRGPEAWLLAREEALARYFKLPKRRRRALWRESAGETAAPEL